MSSESLIHYDPLNFVNLFQSTTLHQFLKRFGLPCKEILQAQKNGSELQQRIVGIGFMDHNKNLTASVNFMS
jgi:hypothetical protein